MAVIKPSLSLKNSKLSSVRNYLQQRYWISSQSDDQSAIEEILSGVIKEIVVSTIDESVRTVLRQQKEAEIQTSIESEVDVLQ